jgi:hypothetical protein
MFKFLKPDKESKTEKILAKFMIFFFICVVVGATLAIIGII